MSEKIVEGLWDCPYCEAKRIGGLTKHCPECGHPQDKDTQFYMGEKKHYLTDEEIDAIGTEPDWVCDYCQSLNNTKYIYCSNCGAPREKETKDYFSNKEKSDSKKNSPVNHTQTNDSIESQSESDTPKSNVKPTINNSESPVNHKQSNIRKLLCIFGALFATISIILGLFALFSPKYVDATVSAMNWERNIDIEEYRTVKENDWTLPSGGRLLYTQSEIRSYNTVLDHYETKTRTVTEQVLDGYDTNTYYTDNGNGTFTEHTSQTPRYRTETKLETYQEPVYRQDPVYDTKYYYEIERWKYERTETSSGTNDTPYWVNCKLNDKERIAKKKATYTISFMDENDKTHQYRCDYDEYKQYKPNDTVKLKLIANCINEIGKNNIQ